MLRNLATLTKRPNLSYGFLSTRFLSSDMENKFKSLSEKVNTLKEDPGNAAKLKLYALFKQATIGANNTPKPGMLDFVKKAKWDAWNDVKDLGKESAMTAYISTVEDLFSKETSDVSSSSSSSDFKTIKTEVKNGAFVITLNRPAKFNAITWEGYKEIGTALKEASSRKDVSVAVMTGSGDYYCAGNDLGNFAQVATQAKGDMLAASKIGADVLERYVASYIDFDKPLIALINGPAIGISVTVLGLFDMVIASSNATFHTPFPSLGQSPEGCSSYTFPYIMGNSKASEMLLFEKKISVQEAFECNLVSRIIPAEKFAEETENIVQRLAALPPMSLAYSKQLIRSWHRDTLHAVNKAECNRLIERWTSEECINAIQQFFARKS